MNIVVKRFSLILLSFFLTNNVYAMEEVKFSKCVDGDTAYFLVNGKEEKFRFLAIDTPESVHPTKKCEPFGLEASKLTCESISNAKKIEVEYEKNKVDKYGRNLAYIYVDGEMIQKTLIKKGYAKVAYIYGKYKYTDELCDIQEDAINKKIGIWSQKDYNVGYCHKEKDNTKKKSREELIIDYIKKEKYEDAFKLLVDGKQNVFLIIAIFVILVIILKKRK